MSKSRLPFLPHPGGRKATREAVSSNTSTFEVIDWWNEGVGEPFHYRVQLDSGTIKYFVFAETKPDENLYNQTDPFGFKVVPEGDWDVALLEHREWDDKLIVASTERLLGDATVRLREATVDAGDLGSWLQPTESERIQIDGMARSAVFAGIGPNGPERVLATWEEWWRYRDVMPISDQLIKVYEWVQGLGITQTFLGYLTENDGSRMIGFVLEPVAVRWAELEDIEGCRAALGKLHGAGIAFGKVRRWSFLARKDGEGVLLRGFSESYKTQDPEVFEQEMAQIEVVLRDEEACLASERGKVEAEAKRVTHDD
jgi:hypothetical protein